MLINDVLDKRMTKKVGLVLISSSLILSGCARHVPEQEPGQGIPEVVQTSNGGGGTHWWYFHNSGGYVGTGGFRSGPGVTSGGVSVGGTTSSGGFKASPSVSARGGFGASGHAFGGSGT